MKIRTLVLLVSILAVLPDPAARADLLVSSRDTANILRYNASTGAFLSIFASGHGLSNPEGITLGPDNNLYVSDRNANAVFRFDGKTGAFISQFVAPGSGGLSGARDVAFGPDGNLYVASNGSNAILVYDGSTGVFLRPLSNTAISGPRGIAFKDGDLFVASETQNQVLRFHLNGTFVGVFASDPALIQVPREMVFGPDGKLYLSSTSNNAVLRFDGTTGASLGIFANTGGLNFPRSLAFGPDGNLYVASADSDNVLRYDATTGHFMGIFASGGGVSFPTGLVFTQTPTFTSAGVTNGASFASGISPGGFATIFGKYLSTVQGVAQAPGFPLPGGLSGTSVTIGGVTAPMFAVVNSNGAEQLNIQVPYEIAGQTSVPVIVTNNGQASPAATVLVQAAQPGIFVVDASNDAAALHGLDNSLLGPAKPAAKGETVVLYVTGLGTVSNSPGTGKAASLTELSHTALQAAVTIAGVNATVTFSGLAPGYAGLYQINVVVPTSVPSGSLDVVVVLNGVASNTAKLAVE